MNDARPEPQARLGTGIPGLDSIMEGGWPAGGTYLIEGKPGTGKSTVGVHFLLEGAANGERCTYITLSESESEVRQAAGSHGWDLSGVEIMDLSGTQSVTASEEDYSVFTPDEVDLNAILSGIRDGVERTDAQRVVVDPIGGIKIMSGAAMRYRQQMLGLKVFFRARNITALLLADVTDDPADAYLQTAVRGLLTLRQALGEYGATRRFLHIEKLRGTTYQTGEHPFRIHTGGIAVFPRLATVKPRTGEIDESLSSGVSALDLLSGGGVQRGTNTVVAGQGSTGKTTLALQFLAQAARLGERARVFSLDESAASIQRRGNALGLSISDLIRSDRLTIERVHSTELYPAEFAMMVRRAVSDGVRMILIDSLSGYQAGVTGEQNLIHHLSQLLDYLAHHKVTTFLTMNQSGPTALAVQDPLGVSHLADNIFLLRFFEADGRVRRAISMLEKRMGRHENTIRELEFTASGIRVGAPLSEFRGVLGGTPEYVGAERSLLQQEDGG